MAKETEFLYNLWKTSSENMPSSHRVHFFHLIWSTKERKHFILPMIEERLYSYIGGIVRNNHGNLLEIGGITNHLHLLLELSNLDHFTGLVRNTKSMSTAWVKKQFPENSDFAWQDGYGSFSVSHSHLSKTHEYIKKQKQHHQQQSFEEEYISFLQFHQISFDTRYVFD